MAASNVHYIWYIFATIALVSAISLIIYGKVVRYLDDEKEPRAQDEAELANELT